jgi:hypothetical protein
METRTNKYGGRECAECGVSVVGLSRNLTPVIDTAHECDPSNVLVENVRRIVARGMAGRISAVTVAVQAVECVGEFLRASDLSVVDGSLNIVEVM